MPHDQIMLDGHGGLVHTYRLMLRTEPGSAVLHELLAQALCDDAAYGDAVTAADAALAIDDTRVGARLARAEALKALGRLDEAAHDFATAADWAPAPATILVNLAITHLARGRPDTAVACLRTAIAHDPGCAEAFATLGAVFARLQKFDEAIVACRQALALDPQQIAAHQNLAAIFGSDQPEAARLHQDVAYRQQQIFASAIPPAARSVLVLTCAAAASVPLEHLLPSPRYAQIQWFIDYARPDQDRSLPCHDLIFNAIGDPDLMPPLAEPVERLLRGTRAPILNHPHQIRHTTRSSLPERLAGLANVVVPAVTRIDRSDTMPHRWQQRHTLPVIIRPTGSHGGKNLHRVETVAAADAMLQRYETAYVTDFVDYCSSTDGLYRKYRMIFVDRVAYPYHLAIGPAWLVHYWTAGMANASARRAEERHFLADPAAAIGAPAMAAVAQIGMKLDLDYAGIDFSVLPDGRVLVFEANATMLVHPERDSMFIYKNAAVSAILTAFDTMLVRRMAG